MNIMVIAPTPFFSDRGCHVRILEEIKAVEKLGYKCTVFTYHLGKNPSNIITKRIKNISQYTKQEAGPSIWKIYLDILLKNLVNKHAKNFDLIHAHLHEGIYVGKDAAKFYNIPLIADLQGSMTMELIDHNFLNLPLSKTFSLTMEKHLLKFPDLFIASSKNFGNLLINDFNIKKNKLEVLEDASDLSLFKNNQNKKKEFDVVYLGVLSKYQGIDSLLKAAYYVQKTNDKIQFLILGYPKVDHYKNMAKKLGLNNVTFKGRIPYNQANNHLNKAKIAITLKKSSTEANGKVLNYMACGLPTIASNTFVNKELLGNHGIYVNPDNPKEIANKVIETLKDNKKLNLISNNLLKRAKNNFSWSSNALKLDKIYKKAIKNKIHSK